MEGGTLMYSTLDELKTLLRAGGADMVGIADLGQLPPDVRDGFPIGISIAVALNPRIILGITEGPTKQYYAEYGRVNDLLDRLGHRAAEFLNRGGYRSTPLAVTLLGIDSKTISTPKPHQNHSFQNHTKTTPKPHQNHAKTMPNRCGFGER